MPRFAYTARDRSGQPIESTLEAPSRKDALRLLTARGLQPVQIEEAVAAKKNSKAATRTEAANKPSNGNGRVRKSDGGKKLTRELRLPFLQSLSDLTTSGLSAGEAVRLLSVRLQDQSLRKLCTGLWERLSEGAALSGAMNEFPEVFDSSTINLIQAGEATGSLNDVLARLISHLVEQKELRRQIQSAMAYPIVIVVVAGGVILFFLFYLLPRLQTMLTSLGGKLPASTQILVGLSTFAMSRYSLVCAIVALLVAVAFKQWRTTTAGREASDAWFLQIPLLGPFLVSRTVLAFSQTLSVLLENGINASEALRMTERQITNSVHRHAFKDATARVLEGEALSASLQRTGCFPALVLDQLAVGENTGNVVPSLKKVATTYQKTISHQLSSFTNILSTGVLICVFVFVGFIAFAIVSAVFQVSSSFKMR